MAWTKEHHWQQAALMLRKALSDEHGISTEGRPHNVFGACPVCRLLHETRWCMSPIPDPEGAHA